MTTVHAAHNKPGVRVLTSPPERVRESVERCPTCHAHIEYPTDQYGRVVARCRHCRTHYPAFVSPPITPLEGVTPLTKAEYDRLPRGKPAINKNSAIQYLRTHADAWHTSNEVADAMERERVGMSNALRQLTRFGVCEKRKRPDARYRTWEYRLVDLGRLVAWGVTVAVLSPEEQLRNRLLQHWRRHPGVWRRAGYLAHIYGLSTMSVSRALYRLKQEGRAELSGHHATTYQWCVYPDRTPTHEGA